VADGLHAGLISPTPGTDLEGWRDRVELCRDHRVVVGGTDAGAHLDMLSSFAMFTTFLSTAVRELGLISLEEAIHLTTDVPARLYGLRGRGTVRPGS